MNAKKAKALRRVMRNMTNMTEDAKLPDRKHMEITARASYEYVTEQAASEAVEAVIAGADTRTTRAVNDTVPQGNVKKVKVKTGQIVNGESKRAVYRQLKKELTKIERKLS